MTEKRFILGVCEEGLGISDNQTKEQYLELDDTHLIRICELLNELNDEKEYCKKRLKDVLRELYCKDRVLEEHNISIECCDNDDR